MTAIAPRQVGRHVWSAADLADPEEWTSTLNPAEVDEVLTATASYRHSNLDDLPLATIASVQLPLLRERVESLRDTLIRGRGFELVNGLPMDELDASHAAAAFVAIGGQIGSARSQNAAGHLLGHVRNVDADASDPDVRIYQTAARQTFHTDSSDVVGLFCLNDAKLGGESLLVSAASVYNEMLDRDQALARLLFEPIATDRRGEVASDEEPFFRIPVLSWFDGALTVMYQRQYIESAQRFNAAPPLTGAVTEALDLFDEIANRSDMHLRMRLAPGDIQFVHNHSLLHDRTRFVDRPGAPRHILRLWLSVPGDRALPDVFASRYGSTTIGDRGGIRV